MKKQLVLLASSALLLASCATTPKAKNYSDKNIKLLISQMTLEEKIGQLFVIRPESLDPQFTTKEAHENYTKGTTKVTSKIEENYNKYPAAGFTLFKKNIKSPEQIKHFNNQLHALGRIPPFIFIDEEGGDVARLANHKAFNLPKYESMLSIGNTEDPQNAYKAGLEIGKYLKKYGFDADFAPVADVNTNPDNPIIGKRAFSSDPEIAAKMNQAFLKGLNQAGIKGCLKHFPGHGDTQTDTHKGYAETLKNWAQLNECELITFKAGIQNNVPMIMVAHITAPNVDPSKVPATFSKLLITEKLRNELNFQGVIISDALEMGAITKDYPPEQASIKAIQAGIDIILIPYDYKTAYTSLLNAVKNSTIPESRIDQSVERILKYKLQ